MQVLENKVENLERRVTKLENYRDSDFKIINQHNENLATIILELKGVTKSLETITNNFKEAINRSNARNEEERKNISERINALEKNFDKLNTKFENSKESIENTIDERTVNKNSDNYDKIKSTIITVIVTAIVSSIITAVIAIMN